MSGALNCAAGIARAYTDAVNRRAYAEAAELFAEDVELIFPGGRLVGAEAWLESRARHEPAELTEEVMADGFTETNGGAELSGRLVQRWVESGSSRARCASALHFTAADGAITRLGFFPLSA